MFFNWYLRLRPTRYAISSLTAKESWKWITVRYSCPMTCTRWRKKLSGSATHRHRLTNRRLTSISSTASGRCSNFRSRSTMKTTSKNTQNNYINTHQDKKHISLIIKLIILSIVIVVAKRW